MIDKRFSRVLGLLFMLNVFFLTWAILWKCSVPFIGDGTQRIINLHPFQNNTRWEMQFNVLLFLPFGFLLSAVMEKKIVRQFLIVAASSVFLEATQYILAIGRSDITDVLLNTLGGAMGICAYYLMTKLFGRYSHIVSIAAGTLMVALEIYISLSFILYGEVELGFIMLRIYSSGMAIFSLRL